MKRILLDVNVALDFVLGRPPFAAPAAELWSLADGGRVKIVLPAHGVTTIHYLAARERGSAFARRLIADLLVVPEIAPVDGPVLRRAVALGWPDFEDAVCAAAAEAAGCDLLMPRDPHGYLQSPVTVVDAPTALSLIRGSEPGDVRERAAHAYGARSRRRGRSRARVAGLRRVTSASRRAGRPGW